MKKLVKVAIIGGFLGSGKTTCILQLGKRLMAELGLRIAIITNDQGDTLVDTKWVGKSGFSVAEVLQGCFCCKFPDFLKSIKGLLEKANPDLILAEPVGSCADLQATVYEPLKKFYEREFALSPFIVLVDGRKLLDVHRRLNLLSPSLGANFFLFISQIKEGEVLALNKIDLLSKEELEEAKTLLRKLNVKAQIIPISAKEGMGMEELVKAVLGWHQDSHILTNFDYEAYERAELELGWLDGSGLIESERPFEVKSLVNGILMGIANCAKEKGGEIAHIKLFFETEDGSTKVSLTAIENDAIMEGMPPSYANKGIIILNARVKLSPESLRKCVEMVLAKTISEHYVRILNLNLRAFSPRPPKPYYRSSEV